MELSKKIVIVGDGACGKTCLLATFARNEFPEEYIPTVFDTVSKTIRFEDRELGLNIWDTAGEEDYDRLRPLSYPGTDLIIICYSINSPDSLHNAKSKWYKEIKHFLKGVPIILVGNKLDLRTKDADYQTVSTEEGLAFSKKMKTSAFIECSAKTMFNVNKIFQTAGLLLTKEKKEKWCCFF